MVITADLVYQILGFIAGGGAVVTLVVQGLKKTLKLDEKQKKWAVLLIHVFAGVLSVLTSVASYYIVIHEQLPKAVLGINTAAVYGVAMVVYNIAKLLTKSMETVETIAAEPTPPQFQTQPTQDLLG